MCTVSAVALNFGSITPGSATDAEGSIGAACTTGTTYTITIDGGSSLVDTNRRLAEAESENYLGYIIAFDESRALDSYIPANGALVSNAIAESSETVNYSVYGRVLADENSAGVVGSYSDTLGITVTY